jgi:hypothetical protein
MLKMREMGCIYNFGLETSWKTFTWKIRKGSGSLTLRQMG